MLIRGVTRATSLNRPGNTGIMSLYVILHFGTVKPILVNSQGTQTCSLYRGIHPIGSLGFSPSRFLVRMLFTG